MPGKHVRFARNNTIHPISPSTLPPPPPLTYDSYSPASTNSLLTPPDYSAPLPPTKSYSHYNAPLQRSHSAHHSSALRLHPLLENSSHPELTYDVRLPPTQIGSKRRVITSEEFRDPATSPRTPSMTIIHKYLRWSIHVRGSGYSKSRGVYYVTVWDVLNAIHTSMRASINQRDYDELGSKHQNRVRKAYEDRYRMYPRGSSAYEEGKMGGVRRVDFLVDFVKFMGLTPHNVEKGEYMLHTDH
ncbi:hypothetical protein AN958_02733 [Leucoagaricus sp. SymC.cos]|nr:hypothetical protein AN958_02733 [Leucoagaricus sp. SymC.cos]